MLPGQDPANLLEKYPQRWLLMHLKDAQEGVPLGSLSGNTDLENDVALGTGQVDFPKVLRTAQRIGVEYYFIEDESPHGRRAGSAKPAVSGIGRVEQRRAEDPAPASAQPARCAADEEMENAR